VPLADLQRALAQLYTREDARAFFRTDPAAFAWSFTLDAADREQLARVGETRLHAYVDSLDRKRANAAARLLPRASSALGPAFRRAFLRFARGTPLPGGRNRYRADARAFLRHVAETRPADLAPEEVALLAREARGLRRRFSGMSLAWIGSILRR
jgi:hypothetical protein